MVHDAELVPPNAEHDLGPMNVWFCRRRGSMAGIPPRSLTNTVLTISRGEHSIRLSRSFLHIETKKAEPPANDENSARTLTFSIENNVTMHTQID